MLLLFPNTSNSQSWTEPKPGVGYSIQVCHTEGRHPTNSCHCYPTGCSLAKEWSCVGLPACALTTVGKLGGSVWSCVLRGHLIWKVTGLYWVHGHKQTEWSVYSLPVTLTQLCFPDLVFAFLWKNEKTRENVWEIFQPVKGALGGQEMCEDMAKLCLSLFLS